MDEKNRTVLITGASSGIGEATARLLGSLGMTVILLSRSESKLQQIALEIREQGGQADFYLLDVSSYPAFEEVVAAVKEKYGRIDVLINNAGVMLLSEVHELKIDEWNQMVDVNFKGVLNGTAGVLNGMREQKSGMIVNVISTAAYRVMKGSSVYSATKFAIKAFSEGLRKEESNNGIRVSLIAPGPTKTNILNHTSSDEMKDSLTNYVENHGLDAKDVANAIAYQLCMPEGASIDELVISTAHKMG